MKKTMFTTLLAVAVWLTGCQPSAGVQEVPEDESQRRELYSTILSNDTYRSEMVAMMQDAPADGMMGNKEHMDGMMGADGIKMKQSPEAMEDMMRQMMARCETDTAACNMMSLMLVRHSGMMQNMMQRMQENGMVDQACMQQMMQRMNTDRR
ncbi:hypothetical protein [Pontibacter akesuensis]|uniref:Uncharacterized protein n=1 Tax=Pontibacter akesuensis TaxID=388950 RepID=A0A1I7KNY8_9BACT|nr:hypothetical protein [Pontibacter akesuensis]GHA81884.1 hypothetical protein GCM10007389_40650 [Pontibacter akesuensis]SFU99076.1 hypothetical protein SAMN04487941_3915 [Pontibacter akesuensis]